MTTDAKLVENAFEQRLSELAPSATTEAADDDAAPTTHVDIVGAHETGAMGNGELDQPDGIDKSDNQYLIGSFSPSGHSINNHSSGLLLASQ